MNKRKLLMTALMAVAVVSVSAQDALRYTFKPNGKKIKGYTEVSSSDRYSAEKGYGYDFVASPEGDSNKPYYFSVKVPDGNYRVTVVLGSNKKAGVTTVRAESRRLFLEHVATKKGQSKTFSFLVNKRNTIINAKERVKIKSREIKKLNWDDKLTIELNGAAPKLQSIVIERDTVAPTVFLCGNSTVVDQDNEPWASWGQMITRFFNDSVCFANFAESGETASTFIAAKRLAKAQTMMKKGDYIFIEFGHNDQKQKFPGSGAYYNFATALKTFVDEARRRGATPVFVTPTQRRAFDNQGKILETHGDYPSAMVWVADREGVKVIDLHSMTRTLFETLGYDNSKKALVHYPAGTWPGQKAELADNTHFNPYGAYEVAKCVIEGMKKINLPIVKFLRPDYKGYNPEHPDDFRTFKWDVSPFTEIEKPDGN